MQVFPYQGFNVNRKTEWLCFFERGFVDEVLCGEKGEQAGDIYIIKRIQGKY